MDKKYNVNKTTKELRHLHHVHNTKNSNTLDQLYKNVDPAHYSYLLFVFQSYPTSLQLLVHTEGEKLILVLEKNE